MIKVKKGNTIMLGLSDMNIERLKAGQPILFNLKESKLADLDVNILIFNGATEESMYMDMIDDIGPNTILV